MSTQRRLYVLRRPKHCPQQVFVPNTVKTKCTTMSSFSHFFVLCMRNSCSFLEPNESNYNFFLSQIFSSCASMVVWLDVVYLVGSRTQSKKKTNETAIVHAVSYTSSIVLRSHTTLTVLRLSFQQVSIKCG